MQRKRRDLFMLRSLQLIYRLLEHPKVLINSHSRRELSKKDFLVFNITIGQIGLLVLSVFAFAFLISETGFVSGQQGHSVGDNVKEKKGTSSFGVFVSWLGGLFGGNDEGAPNNVTEDAGLATLGSHLWDGITYSAIVVGAVQLIGGLVGADKEQIDAVSAAAVAGIMAFKAVNAYQAYQGTQVSGFFAAEGTTGFLGSPISGAGVIGIAVATIVFIAMYKDKSQKTARFECLPWEPPIGGADCEKCNGDENRPCSEYRCKSLGQACELVNKGTTEEKCVWQNPGDVTAPTITPWDDALTEGHEYTSHDTLPDNLGTRIVFSENPSGCIRPFTPLEFGLKNNEPAQCRIDFLHKDKFEDMQFFVGRSNFFVTEHTQRMSLPSPNSLEEVEGLEVGAGGNYDFYVRCQDANGNENVQEFVFSFCVDDTPDTTPPIIVETSISDGSPVAFGTQEIDFALYVNEPSECKWSRQDKDYDNMENSMTCSTQVYEQNARQLYTCADTLTGIEDRVDNVFYFRCRDQPNVAEGQNRNTNAQSYVVNLRGSQELNIIDFKPVADSVISGSTDVVSVDLELETSNGANEGRAICYFSQTGEEGSYVMMFETDSHKHKQTLSLGNGDYDYFFRCIDAGGNSDEANTVFSVFVDRDSPLVTRAYKEGPDALKVVTDEDSTCAYSLDNCNFVFEEGVNMIANPGDLMNHYVTWNSNLVYYIKCKDRYGNQPSPNECSLIASATNVI